MNHQNLDTLRLELSVKAKNGVDFIVAATIIWSLISVVWTLPYPAYNKSVLTFIIGGPMLPLAFLLSKVFKTTWTVKTNPLQPLGLWLNFAQLAYFPILVFVLLRHPDDFVFTYVVITAAHFFPYAWYYNVRAYAVMAVLISIAAMFVALNVGTTNAFWIPVLMTCSLALLAVWVIISYKINKGKYEGLMNP